MSSDINPSYPDSDNPPKSTPEMGDYERKWEGDQSYDLTDVQLRAIGFTVQGLPDTQIAEILHINRRTLWDWKTYSDDYRSALTSARAQFHDSVIDRSQNLFHRAAGVLNKILEDPDVKNRLRSAQILVQNAARLKPPREKLPTTDDDQDDDWPMPDLPPKVG